MTGWGKLSFFVVTLLFVGVQSWKPWKQRHHCKWVTCESDMGKICQKVKGDDGCYKCECKPLCSPPKCDPGCEVQKVFDGPCPGCECKEVPVELKQMCQPVKCGAPCKEVPPESPEECPKCVCDEEFMDDVIKPVGVICDPPKCPRGCSIEKEFDGPCPGCDCKYEEEKPKIICDPPKCPEGCKLTVEYEDACPSCDCSGEGVVEPRNKQCSPPKCPPGCTIQKVFEGRCPGCDCPKDDDDDDDDIICPEIKMDCDRPGCKLVKDEAGCDTCKCEPQCAPPKCRRWCKVKEVEGECPVCDCPKRRFGWHSKTD